MIPNKDNCGRIVALDFSMFIHMGFAVWQKCPSIPAIYTGLSSMIGTLSRVGVQPDDVVLILIDSRPSWRTKLSDEYKANRESLPQEIRDQFNWLKDELNRQTNWIVVDVGQGIEADDVAVTLCKYFKDVPEIILCSSDHDWEQAWSLHDGVKIFSLHSHKWKIRPDNYNVYAEIAKSVNKETSDNLVSKVTNDDEYDKRMMLVDLTRLPEWVEKAIFTYLSDENLYSKYVEHQTVPVGRNSLQPRLDNLYNDDSKFISYDEQKQKIEAKEEREKNKKVKEKLKQKKLNDKIKKLEELENKKGDKNGKVCKDIGKNRTFDVSDQRRAKEYLVQL